MGSWINCPGPGNRSPIPGAPASATAASVSGSRKSDHSVYLMTGHGIGTISVLWRDEASDNCLSLTPAVLTYHMLMHAPVCFLADPSPVGGAGDRQGCCLCPEKPPAWAGDRHRGSMAGGRLACPETLQCPRRDGLAVGNLQKTSPGSDSWPPALGPWLQPPLPVKLSEATVQAPGAPPGDAVRTVTGQGEGGGTCPLVPTLKSQDKWLLRGFPGLRGQGQLILLAFTSSA